MTAQVMQKYRVKSLSSGEDRTLLVTIVIQSEGVRYRGIGLAHEYRQRYENGIYVPADWVASII